MEMEKCLTKTGVFIIMMAMEKEMGIARTYLDLGKMEDKVALRVNFLHLEL